MYDQYHNLIHEKPGTELQRIVNESLLLFYSEFITVI